MKKTMVIHVVHGEKHDILPNMVEKSDGTLWMKSLKTGEATIPILGIGGAPDKNKIKNLAKEKKWGEIPSKYFTHMGQNENGLWVGLDSDWEKHPLRKKEMARLEKEAERERKQVEIYLSARGWGDYSPCVWRGDITRPESEILAECHRALKTGFDVDRPNQTDEEILAEIRSAKEKWTRDNDPEAQKEREKKEQERLQRLIDSKYCFHCESWCYGDCGNYTPKPTWATEKRKLDLAVREANFGINEG